MRLTRYLLIHGAKPVADRPYIERLPAGTEIYKADEVRAVLKYMPSHLQHLIYRDHAFTTDCSGCMAAKQILDDLQEVVG